MTAFESLISLLNDMGIDNVRLVAAQKDKVVSIAIYVNGKVAYSPVVGSGSMIEVEAMIPDMVAEIKKTTVAICNTEIYTKTVKLKEEAAKAAAEAKKAAKPAISTPAKPVVPVKPVAQTMSMDFDEPTDDPDDDDGGVEFKTDLAMEEV